MKKRFGKVNYPEESEAEDNLFGELRAAEGDFKRENAFIAIEKVEKKEQKKFIGLKKEDEVEFEISKIFSDEDLIAQLLGQSPEEAKGCKRKIYFQGKHDQPHRTCRIKSGIV